jgi:hypothetical protein
MLIFQMQNDGCKCPAGFRGDGIKTCEGMSFLQNNSLFKMLHNWCLFSVILILLYEVQRCIFFCSMVELDTTSKFLSTPLNFLLQN